MNKPVKQEPEERPDQDDNWIQIGKALPAWIFKDPAKKSEK